MSSCPRYPLVALWSTACVNVLFYDFFGLAYTQAGMSAWGSLSFVGGCSQVCNFRKGKCLSVRNWKEVWDTDFASIWRRRRRGEKIPSVWQIQKRIWLRHDGILSVSHLCANLLMFHPKWTKKKKSPRQVAVIRRSLLSGSPKKAQTKSGSASVWWVVEIKAERLEYRQHRISHRMISFNSL